MKRRHENISKKLRLRLLGGCLATTLSYGLIAGMAQAAEVKADQNETKPAESVEFEEIVVTGSHIRGVGVSVGSKVAIIDRAEIDKSGFSTVQQVLKSLPQNFQGGPSENTRLGDPALSNFTSASGVNLRGLGAASTLLLVNGRRMPVAGAAIIIFHYALTQHLRKNILVFERVKNRLSH